MIEPQELRIGNKVQDQSGEILTIDTISSDPEISLVQLKEGGYINFDVLKPIPLTEEWSIKFGFEKKILVQNNSDNCGTYSINGYLKNGVFGFFDDSTIEFGIYRAQLFLASFEETLYVHRLQNLYFALEGKELTT